MFGMPSHAHEVLCPSSARRAVRDDHAFKLTYYLGRQGHLQPGMVVGHPDASLAIAAARAPAEAEQLISACLGLAPTSTTGAAAGGSPSVALGAGARNKRNSLVSGHPPGAAGSGDAAAGCGADGEAGAVGGSCAAAGRKVGRQKVKHIHVPGEQTWGHVEGAVPARLCYYDYDYIMAPQRGRPYGANLGSMGRNTGTWSIRSECLSNITSWSRRKGIENTTLPFIPE